MDDALLVRSGKTVRQLNGEFDGLRTGSGPPVSRSRNVSPSHSSVTR
jgi:hypothetical protein